MKKNKDNTTNTNEKNSQSYCASYSKANMSLNAPQFYHGNPYEHLSKLQSEVKDLNSQRILLLGTLAKDNEEFISLNHKTSMLEQTVKSLQNKIERLSEENSLLKKNAISRVEESNSIYSNRILDPYSGLISESSFTLHRKRHTCEVKNDNSLENHKHPRAESSIKPS